MKSATPATPLIASLWHEHSPNVRWIDPHAVPDTEEDMNIFLCLQKRGFDVNRLLASDRKDCRVILTTLFIQHRIEKIRKRIALRKAEQLPLIIAPEDDLHLELAPFWGDVRGGGV
jgi:hypothetical protein